MTTILHYLVEWAEKEPAAVAQRYKKNNEWKSITVREYADRVHALGLYLESQGMGKDDISVIMSYNCPEWVHSDLAPMLIGAKSAGVYPNSTSKDILYILEHTETRFLFVQNKEYFRRIVGDQGEQALPSRIEKVIVFDGDTSISKKAVSYQSVIEEGRRLAQKAGSKTLQAYLAALNPHAGAFLIYTSGTTGRPKGAVLSHDNLLFAIQAVAKRWELSPASENVFSFLPLCHIAEKLQNEGAGIYLHYTVSFCSDFEKVSSELPEVMPTLLLCVPRLWEKMMEGVMKKMEERTGAKKELALWALATGSRVSEIRYSGKKVPLLDQLQLKLADRLVLSKIRAALGLSRTFVAASGAAVLRADVCRWFRSIGVEIMEDYGQTETAGILCLTERHVDSAGTVGQPADDTGFQIAADGEILTQGRHVFLGYFKDPKATEEVLKDGWLYTGDLGEKTERGLIRIRGRKKEIMKTSGGKMVAPVPIEEALKASPLISQVCMVGDGRRFLSALITLSESKLAQVKKTSPAAKLITDPQVVQEISQVIDQVNSQLAGFEQIKKFSIIGREFSVEEGEMTPTLKMKRSVIEARFRDVIDQMYQA
ncbi:MAG: AMP-dependent synthetase/ligase [Bdellovibrionia bacterium]